MGQVCACCRGPRSVYVPEYKKTLPSLSGKSVAITGCTTGTGKVLAEICVEKGASVFLLNRPSKRAEAVLEGVRQLARARGAPEPKHVDCDVGSFESVRGVRRLLEPLLEADGLGGGLDVLCNNAGIMGFPDDGTVDGFEIQMQTNFLGHFILTHDLLPLLEKAADLRGGARVIQHSSAMRKAPDGPREDQELQLKYLQRRPEGGYQYTYTETPLAATRRYQQSKLACLVFSSALHERLTAAGSKVLSLCAHPGVCFTEVMSNSTKAQTGGYEAPCCVKAGFEQIAMTGEDGTMAILMCTADPAVEAGEFYGPRGKDDPKSGNKNHNFGEYSGPAVKMPKEVFNTKEAQEMLWREAVSSTQTGNWKFECS